MAVAQATIPSVQVRFQKKGKLEFAPSRPAKIVVEAGKITIVSLENKFPTINLKAANVEKPKRPARKTSTWISLDIIQNFDAKFTYVNIQVNNPNEMDEVFKMLMIAWTLKKSDVFNDDDTFSIAAPAHIPPPNKKPAVSTVGVGRSGRPATSVDPKGSGQPGFSNDFKKQPTAQNRKAEMNNALKRLFDDYGVGNTSKEQPPMQVHSNPVPKPRLLERKQGEREIIDVFNDDDTFSIAAPPHIPPPNKKVPAVSTVGAGRSGRGGISVDPEGSAHLLFTNYFKKQPTAQNRKAEMNNTLKGFFDDYGVGNTSKEQPPMQVHSNPAPKPRLLERKQEERENVPVITKPSAGLSSFYGNSTNISSISRPTLSNSINRSGTKESLGPSLNRFDRSIVKNDHSDGSSMDPYHQAHRM